MTFFDCWLSQTFWLTLSNQTAAESHCLQTEHINEQLVLPLCHTGTQFKCPHNHFFFFLKLSHFTELDAINSQDNLLIQEFPVCLPSLWWHGSIPTDGNKLADFLVITLGCRLILLCYYVQFISIFYFIVPLWSAAQTHCLSVMIHCMRNAYEGTKLKLAESQMFCLAGF